MAVGMRTRTHVTDTPAPALQLDDSPNLARPLEIGLPEMPKDALGPFDPKHQIKNAFKLA